MKNWKWKIVAAVLAAGILWPLAGCAKQEQCTEDNGQRGKSDKPAPAAKVYIETFDNGMNGWFDTLPLKPFIKPLKIEKGAVVSCSPWWVDFNHAPPGGGYLHLIMGLMTKATGGIFDEVAGHNKFVAGGFPMDFTNAKVTMRTKGNLELRGAQVCMLIQGTIGNICSGWVLTSQPIKVTKDWSEQTITAVYDPNQWTCLGSRYDLTFMYGRIELKTILSDVNTNIYIVLFPINVVPEGGIQGDPDRLRANFDYAVDDSKLPEGCIMIDSINIEFP